MRPENIRLYSDEGVLTRLTNVRIGRRQNPKHAEKLTEWETLLVAEAQRRELDTSYADRWLDRKS